MSPKDPKVRSLTEAKARVHLEKARRFLRSAHRNCDEGDLDPALSNAVLAGINASDVITFSYKGVRSAGENHADALTLLRSCGSEDNEAYNQLRRLLGDKSLAQYDSILATKARTEVAIRHASRLVAIASRRLGNDGDDGAASNLVPAKARSSTRPPQGAAEKVKLLGQVPKR